MRNVEAIKELRDFIQSAKFEFDMGDSQAEPHCGTAGCIGGHAAVLWKEVRIEDDEGEKFSWDNSKLAEKLGLSLREQDQLCYMHEAEGCWSFNAVEREDAVRMLDRLAKGKNVDWNAVLKRKEETER